ncbi:DUF2789 domain-containing protein [Thiomicrorhabdus sp.]|uniref:DUF2789 domain-containing protein n=1 Tax=Thiomicrorhabdus sp. TaxID=2039724 RepID=UPI0029C66DCE|nr:DUF2789 domain-containing protein [Thiomicrorhabdus sp.]
MDTGEHSLNTLFQQLGLDHSDSAIEAFIERHRGIKPDIRLEQASFWNPSQSAFLHEALEEDADWAEIVDQLDTLLRS